MSDCDPDYIPTPSQLPDQGDSDFDPDIEDLCRVADRRPFSSGNFDVGISDLIPSTQIPQSTPRSTRASTLISAHDRSVSLMDQALLKASHDSLFPPEELSEDSATRQFSISNILYGKKSTPPSDQTPSSSTRAHSANRELEMEKIVSRFLANTVPENTLKKNVTALNAFRDFARTDETVKSPWEELPLSRMPNALVRFVAARGEHYEQRTFHSLLGGLNRVLRARCDDQGETKEDYNIFKHRRFRPFQLVYDGYVKEKQYSMPATLGNQPDHLTSEQLTQLLTVLGSSSPEQLLTTLIFLTTYTFAIRGGTELSYMTPQNFTFKLTDKEVETTYTENAAKNRQPGMKNIHHQRRRVTHVSKLSDRTSFYHYYHLYLDRCCPSMRGSQIKLFQHPLKLAAADAERHTIWYGTKRALGRNYFNLLIKKYYEKACLGKHGEKLSLRSLRATVTTKLNEQGVDDNVIMARTGHKSQAGLDRYKRPGLTKNVARVSQILTLDSPRDYRERMLTIALILIVILVTFILTRMLN